MKKFCVLQCRRRLRKDVTDEVACRLQERSDMEENLMNSGMDFTVREIAQACGGTAYMKSEEEYDMNVTSVVLDSRKVEAGGVFLATVGERVDGHSFINRVFREGALLVVTQKKPEQVQEETGEACDEWGNYILVEDTLLALKKIAEAYRKKRGIPIVGITGSVGKTSTKEFIATVLAEEFNVLKTEGNFNNEIGVPLTLLRLRPEHELAVVEMGISDFGEMHRLSKMVRPNVCVITNIGQCHLENLKTRDGILSAKSEIFDFMAEDGEICLNGEDDKLATIGEMKGHKPHFFGFGSLPGEDVIAKDIMGKGLFGSDATLKIGRDRFIRVHVPLPGKHMVLNAAAATCVAELFGLTDEQIAAGIGRVAPVDGRNHLISMPDYTLIDDCYNANPGSMRAALELLSMADTYKTAILGDMFELGENSDALHGEVGSYAVQTGTDTLICVGENALSMYKKACVTKDETQANTKLFYFPDREELMQTLEEAKDTYLPKGCTVLVKASHGMEFAKVVDYLSK